MHPLVSRVVHIGTVFAAEIADTSSAGTGGGSTGYAAGAGALAAVRRLRAQHGVFARPLGGVVYFMVPPTTDRRRCAGLVGALLQVLDELHAGSSGAGGGDGQPGARHSGQDEGCVV